jgi:hypothetical protein
MPIFKRRPTAGSAFSIPDGIFDPHFLNRLAAAPLDPAKVNVVPRTTRTDFDVGYRLVDAQTYDVSPLWVRETCHEQAFADPPSTPPSDHRMPSRPGRSTLVR